MAFFQNRYKKIAKDFTTDVTIQPALRVNTLRIKTEDLAKRLKKKSVKLTKIPYLKDGYWYEANFSLGATPEYLLGYYYLQGPASQAVGEILGPGKRVLDMAAAPGSKATHLAQLMKNEGVIFALDANAKRLEALRNNCERLLVKNTILIKKDSRYVADLTEQFDTILLDVPCSGNFCSEQAWFSNRRIEDVKSNARKQKELFQAAYNVLESNGKLLYSTCSLEPEEDELIIDWALKKFPDLEVLPIKLKKGDPGITSWEGKELDKRIAKTKRFWPHRTGTEGFFIALLRKKAKKTIL